MVKGIVETLSGLANRCARSPDNLAQPGDICLKAASIEAETSETTMAAREEKE